MRVRPQGMSAQPGSDLSDDALQLVGGVHEHPLTEAARQRALVKHQPRQAEHLEFGVQKLDTAPTERCHHQLHAGALPFDLRSRLGGPRIEAAARLAHRLAVRTHHRRLAPQPVLERAHHRAPRLDVRSQLRRSARIGTEHA